MPQHKSAIKRVRQIERRRKRNIMNRSRMRTAIKKIRNAPDKESAVKELSSTLSVIDSMVNKGIIHKNKAANLKSKLSKHVAGLK